MYSIIKKIIKELGILLLICGTFFIINFLFSFISFYINTSTQYAQIQEKRKVNLDELSNTLTSLINENPDSNRQVNCNFKSDQIQPTDVRKLQDSAELLFTLTKMSKINFSVLKYDQVTKFTTMGDSYSCGPNKNLEAQYEVTGKAETLKSVILKTTEVGKIRLTIGIPILGSLAVLKDFLSSVTKFINETILLTMILLIIIIYYLGDFIFLCSLIGKSNWKQKLKEKVIESKSKALTQFICSILLLNEELESQLIKLKHGVEPILIKYMNLPGKQKKITDAVYVELDWIGHTPYVVKFGLSEVVNVKNQINHIGRVLVSRYDGLIIEAKSDMVSFIIDSGSLIENKLLATACIRDFFIALDNLSSKLNNKEIKIKYRGSIVVDTFEFEVTQDGYSFNSKAYYLAARMSKIEKSKDHHAFVLHRDSMGIDQLAVLSIGKTVNLRGLGDYEYCTIDSFTNVDLVLSEGKFVLLKYFRNENDIISMFKFCCDSILKSEYNVIDQIFTQLRDFHIEEFIMTDRLPFHYLELLDLMLERCNEFQIATAVSISRVLFSANMDNQMITDYFKKMAQTQIPRLKANLIESYNELTKYQDQGWSKSMMDHENNRLRGNIIIGACQDEISDYYRQKIDELIVHDNPIYIASGLFVMGHLYRLFYIKNKVYFGNNDWFKTVPNRLRKYSGHENAVVKNRAYEELSKIVSLV